MKLARQLLDTLSGEWNAADYHDTYTEALRDVIEAKAKGKEPAAPKRAAPARVTDLMTALKRSLKEPREVGNATGRRQAASRKTAHSRRHRAA